MYPRIFFLLNPLVPDICVFLVMYGLIMVIYGDYWSVLTFDDV